MRRGRGEEGSSLLVSMFIVMLAFLITMAVTTRATLTVGAVKRALWEAHAFNSAEAGLALAVQGLVEEVEGSRTGLWVPHGMASYHVVLTERGRHGPWRRLQVVSHGKCKVIHVKLQAKLILRHVHEDFQPEVRLLEWQQLPPGRAP